MNEVEADRANTLEEHTDSGPPTALRSFWGDDFASYATADTFSWAVRSNAMFTRGLQRQLGPGYFGHGRGGTDNKTLKVGIIEPHGTRRYVVSSGDIIISLFWTRQAGTGCLWRMTIPWSSMWSVPISYSDDVGSCQGGRVPPVFGLTILQT